MSDNTIKLIDSNPQAYNELKAIWPKYGYLSYKKEDVSAYSTGVLGEWECANGHIWGSEIACRAEQDNDMECPICKNHQLMLNPKLLNHGIVSKRIRFTTRSCWYCKECRQIFFLYDEYVPNYNADAHHLCIPEENPLFSEEYPELAEEWSEKNLLKADEVDCYYAGDVLWQCNVCQNEWTANTVQRINGKKPCPFCSGIQPIPGNNTLFDLFPNQMKDWSYRLNKLIDPLRLKEDSSNVAVWDCNVCGLSYAAKISEKMKATHSICPHCETLKITKEDTQKIYSEYIPHVAKDTYNYDFFLNPENKNRQEWLCKKCDSIWYASAYERFFDRKECPYCSGELAIPGKTSFKVLFPNIEKEIYWEADDKVIDTDNILPSYASITFKWKCNECNMIWRSSIYERCIEGNSCPYCSGKYAIPGKTSLIARYPKLIAQTWVYQSNIYICNPDTILPNTYKRCWFQCPDCGHTSYISVNRYIQNYNRGISNCAHCKGFRRIKSRLF